VLPLASQPLPLSKSELRMINFWYLTKGGGATEERAVSMVSVTGQPWSGGSFRWSPAKAGILFHLPFEAKAMTGLLGCRAEQPHPRPTLQHPQQPLQPWRLPLCLAGKIPIKPTEWKRTSCVASDGVALTIRAYV
jgi:hypothetical protein